MEEFAESGVDPLTVSLYQMDLDRTQFLLRSYLRIRLQKVGIVVVVYSLFFFRFPGLGVFHFQGKNCALQIEKYAFHILNTAELFGRLSKEEKLFAER